MSPNPIPNPNPHPLPHPLNQPPFNLTPTSLHDFAILLKKTTTNTHNPLQVTDAELDALKKGLNAATQYFNDLIDGLENKHKFVVSDAGIAAALVVVLQTWGNTNDPALQSIISKLGTSGGSNDGPTMTH